MRTFAIAAAAAAAAALLAGPAFAQGQHTQHHPPPAAAQDPTAAPTHEMCKSLMDRQMEGKAVHDHGRDKTGAMTWPDGKPLTAAEMEKMHKACAEKMQKTDPAPKAK